MAIATTEYVLFNARPPPRCCPVALTKRVYHRFREIDDLANAEKSFYHLRIPIS